MAKDVKGVFRIGEEHGLDPGKIAISWGSHCRRWGVELIVSQGAPNTEEERGKFD
jgi:hypothetical protein